MARRTNIFLLLLLPVAFLTRRGFWWVKWQDTVHFDRTPAWWQVPFPIQ